VNRKEIDIVKNSTKERNIRIGIRIKLTKKRKELEVKRSYRV